MLVLVILEIQIISNVVPLDNSMLIILRLMVLKWYSLLGDILCIGIVDHFGTVEIIIKFISLPTEFRSKVLRT